MANLRKDNYDSELSVGTVVKIISGIVATIVGVLAIVDWVKDNNDNKSLPQETTQSQVSTVTEQNETVEIPDEVVTTTETTTTMTTTTVQTEPPEPPSENTSQTVETSDTNITHLVDVLQPFESNDYEMFNGVNSVMMGGIERFNGFTLSVYGWNGQSCAIYNLNSKYKELTGVIGYVDGRTGDGDTWNTYIFADDKPIFECAVKPGDLPYEFDVDLTGVTKLEFRTGETNGRNGIIGFAELDIS